MIDRIYSILFISFFIQAFVLSITGMVDCAVVGRWCGTDGLTSMQLAMPVFLVLTVPSIIGANGISIVISREIGQGRKNNAVAAYIVIGNLLVPMLCIFSLGKTFGLIGIYAAFGLNELIMTLIGVVFMVTAGRLRSSVMDPLGQYMSSGIMALDMNIRNEQDVIDASASESLSIRTVSY